jgi:predicted GIY-YIG superfamily endonuclease
MCKRCKQILGLNKKIDLEPEIVASAADIVKEETAIETEKQVNNVKKLVKAKKDRPRNYKYKFCAYVVRCKDKTLYFGITTIDLKKAIKNHNNGCGSVYTKIRRPVVLLKSLNATSMIKANFRKSELKREYKQ